MGKPPFNFGIIGRIAINNLQIPKPLVEKIYYKKHPKFKILNKKLSLKQFQIAFNSEKTTPETRAALITLTMVDNFNFAKNWTYDVKELQYPVFYIIKEDGGGLFIESDIPSTFKKDILEFQYTQNSYENVLKGWERGAGSQEIKLLLIKDELIKGFIELNRVLNWINREVRAAAGKGDYTSTVDSDLDLNPEDEIDFDYLVKMDDKVRLLDKIQEQLNQNNFLEVLDVIGVDVKSLFSFLEALKEKLIRGGHNTWDKDLQHEFIQLLAIDLTLVINLNAEVIAKIRDATFKDVTKKLRANFAVPEYKRILDPNNKDPKGFALIYEYKRNFE